MSRCFWQQMKFFWEWAILLILQAFSTLRLIFMLIFSIRKTKLINMHKRFYSKLVSPFVTMCGILQPSRSRFNFTCFEGVTDPSHAQLEGDDRSYTVVGIRKKLNAQGLLLHFSFPLSFLQWELFRERMKWLCEKGNLKKVSTRGH